MADVIFQNTKKKPWKKQFTEKLFWILLLIISFFIVGNIQIHTDDNEQTAHIKKSFLDYEDNIIKTYSFIEYTDTMEFIKMTNGRNTTHYILTEQYRIDLKKKRVYSRILDFNLISGKNEKNRYTGKETEISLKKLYFFSEYYHKKWKHPFVNDDDSYITFRSSKWLIPLSITMVYDPQNYFPKKIGVNSDSGKINISLMYMKTDGVYMLYELQSDVKVNIAFISYHFQTYVTRSHYKFYK